MFSHILLFRFYKITLPSHLSLSVKMCHLASSVIVWYKVFAESEDDGPIALLPFGGRHFFPERLAERSTPHSPAFLLSRISHIALSLRHPSRSCGSCKWRNTFVIFVVHPPTTRFLTFCCLSLLTPCLFPRLLGKVCNDYSRSCV